MNRHIFFNEMELTLRTRSTSFLQESIATRPGVPVQETVQETVQEIGLTHDSHQVVVSGAFRPPVRHDAGFGSGFNALIPFPVPISRAADLRAGAGLCFPLSSRLVCWQLGSLGSTNAHQHERQR